MKIVMILLFPALLFGNISYGQSTADLESKSNSFFKKYVKNGLVNYTTLSTSKSELNALVTQVGQAKIATAGNSEKKAFYINAYNLLVINQVLKNYPIKSVMDVPGFFDKNKFMVAGESMTLNDLENKKLREVYKDARVHFVLVCGAVGCPPIISESYKASQLDNQLKRQTKLALNDPKFIQTKDGSTKISEIFKWYESDFTASKKSVLEYINDFRTSKIPTSQKPQYYTYNWALNENNNDQGMVVPAATALPSQPENTASPTGINLQTYNAGSLLKKGQLDVTLFNSIYTENEQNWKGEVYSGYRTTFASSLLQFTYGITKNARFNIGLDINLKSSATRSDDAYSSISGAFDFDNNDSTRAGVAYIAPKIKVQPFKEVDDFSFQSSFIVAIPKDPEGYTNPDGSGDGNLYWIEWDRYVWWTQFFYSKQFLNDKFQLFMEADLLIRFAKNEKQITHTDFPISAFVSWFPTNKFTVYGMFQHVPRMVYNTENPRTNDWVIGADYSQFGTGIKYQVASSVNIELLYTNFFRAVNNGLGETFNIGIKYII